jgi:hypothetical protein
VCRVASSFNYRRFFLKFLNFLVQVQRQLVLVLIGFVHGYYEYGGSHRGSFVRSFVRSYVRMNDKDATRMQSYTLLWPVRFAERGAAAG